MNFVSFTFGGKMKKILALCILLMLLVACAPEAPPSTSTLPPANTATLEPPTDIPEPTATTTPDYTPTPDIPRELIEVPYDDRIIRGTMVGDGPVAVILAPMFGETRANWMPFAKYIATLGYTAVAIDFPGSGISTGSFSYSKVNTDVVAVFDFLKARGYEKIVCMGGSLGAGACFQAARMRPEMTGVVVIAAPPVTTEEEATMLTMPKLFLVGKEPDLKKEMDAIYALLPEPKEFKTINNPAHGTNLLHTDAAEEFMGILVEFLESLQ